MKDLLEKVRRSAIWQVVVVYIGASWVLLQAIDLFADNLALPEWLFSSAAILLLLGLPIILATAFIQRRLAASGEDADEAHEKLFTWRNALLGGAGAFLLLFGFAGLYVVIQDRGETFRPADALADEAVPGVAVLPFSVRAPGMDYWREGVIDALAMNFEGISGLRSIHSGTVLARWQEEAAEAVEVDHATRMGIARSTGARYAVSGSVVGTPDSVRISGTVVDLTDGTTLGRPTVEGSAGDVMGLVDRFSVEAVRAIGLATEGELGALDLREITTASPDALRHYLVGASRYRRGELDLAQAALDSAVARDSTFAHALYLRGRVGPFALLEGTGGSAEAVDMLLRAREYSNSKRLELLIRGTLAYQWGNSSWVPGFDRDSLAATIADLEAALRRDPSDAELWELLGEVYWHSGTMIPNSHDMAIAAFEAHAERAPGLRVHNGHLYNAYFGAHDSAGVRRLLAADERTAPGSEPVQIRKLLYRVAFEDLSDDELTAAFDSLRVLRYPFSRNLDGIGVLWGNLTSPVYWTVLKDTFDPDRAPWCWRGLDAGDLDWFLENVPTISVDDLAIFCSWLVHAYGLSLHTPRLDSILVAHPDHWLSVLFHADRGEYEELTSLLSAQRDSVAIARVQGDSTLVRLHEARFVQLEAYLDWKRDGQPGRAAERMQSVDQFVGPLLLVTPQMLVESDQPREAARILQFTFDRFDLTPVLYRLAPLYEELGEPDKARAAYAEFVERWKNADPRLQPMVDTARAALERLGPIDQ